MADLLMFGARYPKIQKEFSIVELGQSWQDPEKNGLVGILTRHWQVPGRRFALLRMRAGILKRDYRFAIRVLD